MAGQGPPPKPASRRARTNKDPIAGRTLPLVRQDAPQLPDLGLDKNGELQEWHPRTVEWWRMWSESELSTDFTASDWSFLLDSALLHHNYWANGHWTLAAELRLRVAKFGATPEDRARLRITFEGADEAEDKGRARRERGGVKQPTKRDDPRKLFAV